MRQGIYVSINNGKLDSFTTFMNISFRSPFLLQQNLHTNVKKLILENMEENKGQLQKNNYWNNKGCMINNIVKFPQEQNGYEIYQTHQEVKFFLMNLCKKRKIRDCHFFLNVYDQLIIHKNLENPFWHLGDIKTNLMKSIYKNSKYAPIVSLCWRENVTDIPFIFQDDIQRIYKLYAKPKCSNGYIQLDNIKDNWKEKKNIAVFRGSVTGCGFTPDTNQRIKLKEIALKYPDLFDVELIGEDKIRFRKNRKLSYIDYRTTTQYLSNSDKAIPFVEQSKYKYLIYVEGNVAAYRLSAMFALGSVIFYVIGDDYRPWFYPQMKHLENCIMVKDVTQLPKMIEWCKQNDTLCHKIAKNSKMLYKKYLSEHAMYDYIQLMFTLF